MHKKYLLIFLFTIYSFSINAQQSDFGEIDFKKADSIAAIYKGEDLKHLHILTYKLTNSLETDVEKFRAIYKWVCDNIKNDYTAFSTNRNKRYKFRNDSLKLREWNSHFVPIVIKKLYEKKKTLCTGYAYLVKRMANIVDIECEIINGYGRTPAIVDEKNKIPNHSWNVVLLKDKWYLCDPTWSSGYTDLDVNRYIFEYVDGYFLTNPRFFSKTHYPLEKKWLLTESNLALEKFHESPLLYEKAFKHKLFPVSPSKMNIRVSKNDTLTFVMEQEQKNRNQKIDLMIVSGKNTIRTKPEIIYKENGIVELKREFKTKGTYDVHIRVDGEVICTYVVKVVRKKR
ncbi:transglutaminase domain-containing protein [Aureivirga sp. CE67]|uniref:transglutaminase domain-containing protein n=1 Tax=Aureivirga sp. CE67 TaxID=1788983 RepID=UPI0018CB5516|nr:transglutaminase domain-containing protein [Aureivirga sp. CE67]